MLHYRKNDPKLIPTTPGDLIKRRVDILEYIIRNYNYVPASTLATNKNQKTTYLNRQLNELHRHGILDKRQHRHQYLYSISTRYYNKVEKMVYPETEPTQQRPAFSDKGAIRSLFISKLYTYIGNKELFNAAKYQHIFNKTQINEKDPQPLRGNFYNLYISLDDPYRIFILDTGHNPHYILGQIQKIAEIMEYSFKPYSIDIITYSNLKKKNFETSVVQTIINTAKNPRLLNKYNYGSGNRLIFMNIINLNINLPTQGNKPI